ncbi:MAG: hypothetical protein JJU28_19960 [Cyclobacteriaceae bacterium]|nr:hypothetical protein [Cyclobacteriaceae bacterium]
MKEKIIDLILEKRQFLTKNAHKLVIDADTHISDIPNLDTSLKSAISASPDYYQGRPIDAGILSREIGQAGADMALIWQNPAATLYTADEEQNFQNLLKANQYIFDCMVQQPTHFIGAGWTDPKALGTEAAIEIARICIQEFGFPVVKMNPAQNAFPMDDLMVFQVVEAIIGMGATPAFHYGADSEFTPPESLEKMASTFEGSPILAVHMGGGGAGYLEAEHHYKASRELGLKYPNIKYILSAKRDTHIESDLITYQLAGAPFNENLFCASDAPYGNISWNFGGFRALFASLLNDKDHPDERLRNNPGLFHESDVQRYLGGNFARFMAGRYDHLLKCWNHDIEI